MTRKEIAKLLERDKGELARIRVEQIIREDYIIETLEILELYCSLLVSRFRPENHLLNGLRNRGTSRSVHTASEKSVLLNRTLLYARPLKFTLLTRIGLPGKVRVD